MSPITLVGIDCATDPKRVGLALAKLTAKKPRVLETALGSGPRSVAMRIAEWISGADRVLLALDAPLGWPAALGKCLAGHRAGQPILDDPNEVFRRGTDRFIRWTLGKQPLDVGATRIARTAHAALGLLKELRLLTGEPIPLAWSPAFEEKIAAIEVYPASTLIVQGLPATGYKPPKQRDRRLEILDGLRGLVTLPKDVSLLADNADALDAAICVLAAADFLSGRAMEPADTEKAAIEGWIWVRRPHNPG